MKPSFRFHRCYLLSLACAVVPMALRAQVPGDQDATFATGPASQGSVHALALQANGQVLVGGEFSQFRGSARNGVARLNTDGSLDTFNPGLAITGSNGNAPGVFALGLQADGQVIVAGQFNVLGQPPSGGVARLKANGSLDATFNVGTGVVDNGGGVGEAQAVAVLANGQILVGGAFTHFDGVRAPGLARLNANGSLDKTFNAGGAGIVTNGYGNGVQAIVVLANGQILIGGGFSSYNGVAEGGVARLNADGSLDKTFQSGEGADYAVNTLAVQANGQILAGGGFNNFDGANIAPHLVRLNTDGSLDTSYLPTTPGIFIAEIDALIVQPDGAVLAGGDFLNEDGLINTPGTGLLRLNADGTLDARFDGSNNVGQAVALALQPDGKALVAQDAAGFAAVGPGDVLRVYDTANLSAPTVTVVAAGDAEAFEGGAKAKVFFERTGDVSADLTVFYKVKGSAQAGVDYKPLSGTLIIPAGSSKAKIKIKPLNNDVADGTTKAKVKLLPPTDGSYNVGDPAVAKVKVIDND